MPSKSHVLSTEWTKVDGESSQKVQDSSGDDVVDDRAMIEKLDKTLSQQFEDEMRDLAKPTSHSKVAVQLLSWEFDEEREDYIDTRQELLDLQDVFKEKYNFTVRSNLMHTRNNEPARHQLSNILSEFLLAHDRKDTLLIIYYGGHGIKGRDDGQLTWLPGNPSVTNNGLTEIVWTSAEHQLDRVDADVLLIFDCCHAGILERQPRGPHANPIFEFIGSTPFNRTARGPGDHSFTRAMITSLEQLSDRKDGFTTYELLQCIKTLDDFLYTGQQPVTSERGKKVSFKKLQIKPLSTTIDGDSAVTDSSSEASDSFNCYLPLKFVLSRKPTPADITALTKSLHNLVHHEHVPIRDVIWDKLTAKLNLRDAVRMVVHRNSQDRRKHSISSINSLEIPKSVDNQSSLDLTMSPIPEIDDHKRTEVVDEPSYVKRPRRTDSLRSHISNDSRYDVEASIPNKPVIYAMLFAFTFGVTFARGPDLLRLWLRPSRGLGR